MSTTQEFELSARRETISLLKRQRAIARSLMVTCLGAGIVAALVVLIVSRP